jgi:CelD/BcsL family acetyltransferase involved in cellulose biosynthesis
VAPAAEPAPLWSRDARGAALVPGHERAELSAVIHEDPAALDGLGETWSRLWATTRPRSPMLERRWVSRWWRLHRRDGRLMLIAVTDRAGEVVGLAPLYLRRDLRDPRRLLRTIHFLGTGEREADEVAAEYLGWLAPPELVPAVTAAVATALRTRTGAWDRLQLVNTCPEQDLPAQLRRALAAVSQVASDRVRPSFRIAVSPSERYVAELTSSSFRHRCRRAMRAGVEAGVQLVTATTPEEIRDLYAALVELHQRRWQARGHAGAFGSALFRDFHGHLLPAYVADGTAWLAGLRQGDRWLAARYHLRVGDTVYDYLSGVDTEAPAALGPGLLLTLHALDWCAQNGIRTYDLLAGDYDYKRKLATAEGSLVDLDLFARTLSARLWLGVRALRARMRRPSPAPASTPAST